MFDTLLRIRLFVAVYEERSFTTAAARENATQSGVTQHVQKLEDHLNVKLFVRGSGSVQPTPAGDAYYQGCVQVLRAHQQARRAVDPYSGGLSGEVVVGLTPTLTRAVLAPALARFVADQPNVVVRVIDAYSNIISEKVRAGELDFGIVPGLHRADGMRCEPFVRTPEFLVSGPHSGLQLRHGDGVRLRDLKPLKLVLPSKAQVRRSTLENYLASVGAVVERRLEIDTSLGSLDFVARTDWVSVHPALMMLRDMDDGGFVVNPLVDPPLTLDLFRLERAREPLAPAAAAFFDALHLQAREMAARAQALVDAASLPAGS